MNLLKRKGIKVKRKIFISGKKKRKKIVFDAEEKTLSLQSPIKTGYGM